MIPGDTIEIQSQVFSLPSPRCSLPKSQGNLLWRRQRKCLTKVILNNYPGGGMDVLGSKRKERGGSVCVIGLLDRVAKRQGVL